ncbi:MAG TPA: 23S rRNA (guanosine(2251)-2'-O)-methyltransferase RlmB [Acidimicrobiales bacterium]|nr:23S rRNA (guanosine(2251)-2'-O)-methyltransferase RlmB [Acidimicrobiales bacterium]
MSGPSRRRRPATPGRSAPPPRSGPTGRAGASGRGSATGRGATPRRAVPGRGAGTGPADPSSGDRARRSGGGHGLGGEQVEGRQAVRELLAAGRRPVREVWIAEDLDPSPQIDDIERLATRRRVRLVLVPRTKLERAARTDAPQGVLAHARALEEVELETLCRKRQGHVPFLLVLDGVTDPHNVGALLRSAECAGVNGVVLPRHRAVHVTPTVAKVAAGAVEHLDIAIVPGVPNALRQLDDLGVISVGLDAEAPTSLFDLDLEASIGVALVMGAEGRGLAALTRRRCSALAAIPQFGGLGSLNVAAAGAVACFEVMRRRLAAASGETG